MMLIGWLPSLAHDFEVDGVFYNETSDNTVAVTFEGNSYNDTWMEYIGDVVIPSSVNYYYNGVTYSVTSIGYGAFAYCTWLTSIEIPNSVTSIGNSAFEGCSSLTSIEIPNSVTSIGINAFANCSSLTSIVVDAGNSKYDSRNGCNAIIETASNTLIAGCQNTIIPNSVTSIGDDAFYWCTSLTSIEIPNSVTSIGDYAFYECTSLTSIEIPNSVTSIGWGAFSGCSSLTSIQIPNSVTSIGNGVFSGCSSMISIEIPNSVTSIGYGAFYECESLTKIICRATTPPTIESQTFSNYSADLYVPVGCKATYESAEYWKNFNNIIEVTLDNPITLNDNNVTVASIGDYIVVKNATAGSVVRVYTADGAMIASEVATDGDIVVEVPAKGVYVVKVGKQTVKVII